MKVYTVATKPHYNAWHANRLLKQFDTFYNGYIEMYCYTDNVEGFDDRINVIKIPQRKYDVERQWNKIDFFSKDFITPGEEIIVSDLDWTFLDNVTDIIDTPVTSGEFIGVYRWWFAPEPNLLNGGMYKFISGEMHHIHHSFYTAPLFWQSFFIHSGDAQPPVNGEQNFVQLHAKQKHKIKWFEPIDAIGRLPKDKQRLEEYNMCYLTRTKNNDFFYVGGEFNPKIRMVQSIL